jgi:hypothetical protein
VSKTNQRETHHILPRTFFFCGFFTNLRPKSITEPSCGRSVTSLPSFVIQALLIALSSPAENVVNTLLGFLFGTALQYRDA